MNSPQNHQDLEEISNFSARAQQWWDEEGDFALLHRLNPLRLRYIHDLLGDVRGLKILDVGCGGGLLAEPLARKGATITAIDASAETIKVAAEHAQMQGLNIDYQCGSLEILDHDNFDAILAMEVIEHVTNLQSFITTCAAKLKPQGKIVLSTINRTPEAFLFAIIGAEYVLRWLPIGTHHYHKFVRPDELADRLKEARCKPVGQTGVVYSPLSQNFYLSSNSRINYMMVGAKQSSPLHE